ncbi:MAG TPA: VTT domain-containing protein, partial [Candidatus Thermoplasmatota archaeon]|nr:VTT domain-containing protein [Candidatus Thermoplasmatota archaeon]
GLGLGWLGLLLGKIVGTWMLYLVGDSLHKTLERQTAKSPRLKRVVAWLQARASTTGFVWVFLLSFVPFLPDTLILAFAVAGMGFRPFILGIALGTVAKYGAIVLALAWVGPDAVQGWLDALGYWVNPFHWLP